jgi:hypothetical protein
MGFADSFDQYLVFMFIAAWVGLLIVMRLVKTVDDKGEGRKAANDWFVEWLRRRFK